MKLNQGHDVSTKTIYTTLNKDLQLSKSQPDVWNALQGDEEVVIENMRGSHGNDCRVFLTILDNVLTVGESAVSEEQAFWPHSYPGGLLEEAAGCAKNGALADFAEAFWW
jgi:hypothetical protein